tara:strand:+ start:529 stop:2214 length:1686 start_codon:yes stop_codon:yes gene_type:complete
MFDIIIFFTFYYIILLSIIGYGIFFHNICFSSLKSLSEPQSIYIGFYGLFFITLISLFTSIFVPHSFFHNIIILIFGIFAFFRIQINGKKKFIKIIFFLSLFFISALLISKTHDDFSYYHLPFTKYLTEQKVIFGMGHLNHGYNLLSSLFFLNSVFYLPFIEYYSFHFTLIIFLIFFNYFIFKEILYTKNSDIIKYLYLFSLIFFNLSFNRLAEYGTDKAGQLLIVLVIIKLIQNVCFSKEKNWADKILFLIPLLAFCISLKTYFLPYILLGILVIFLYFRSFKILNLIFYSKSFAFFLLLLALNFIHHFISTGCIISPLPYTCFGESVIWGKDIEVINNLSVWLEQWAKAGAGPNFRVDNVEEYLVNFNWVSNWFDKYFLVKFLDQLAILLTSFLLIFLIYKKFELKNDKIFLNKKIYYFYFTILIIFLIWFCKHPTLRYGGYSVVFLTLSIPVTIIFENFKNRKFFFKRSIFLVIFVSILFNVKNLNRINKEFERGDLYQFKNFPFYAIQDKKFSKKRFESGLIIYAAHHCWATKSPCGHLSEELDVIKLNSYYFIIKN